MLGCWPEKLCKYGRARREEFLRGASERRRGGGGVEVDESVGFGGGEVEKREF